MYKKYYEMYCAPYLLNIMFFSLSWSIFPIAAFFCFGVADHYFPFNFTKYNKNQETFVVPNLFPVVLPMYLKKEYLMHKGSEIVLSCQRRAKKIISFMPINPHFQTTKTGHTALCHFLVQILSCCWGEGSFWLRKAH